MSIAVSVDREIFGSVWTPPVALERTPDGRPVFVVGGKRYVEVPLGSEDAYRFLASLRTQMAPADFRAFVERHRGSVSAAVLWRLGLGPIPLAPGSPDRVEKARDGLRRLMRAA